MITPTASFVVRKWIRGYEKGIYTHIEVLSALVHAAATHAPAELAATMPSDWLEKVRQDSASPPRSPEDGVYIGSALLRAGASYEEWEAQMRQKWFDAIWTWHRYFAEQAVPPDRDGIP